MYNVAQYTAPEGSYTTVKAADNTQWYKEYPANKNENMQPKTPGGKLVTRNNPGASQKLPGLPPRKDSK